MYAYILVYMCVLCVTYVCLCVSVYVCVYVCMYWDWPIVKFKYHHDNIAIFHDNDSILIVPSSLLGSVGWLCVKLYWSEIVSQLY